ncbi:MAG TPA: class I SAM-dependent methyltransferase [Rickettsia endosymbiont of Degeeriella rufa]|nr:class I SAM-dependent methyltransferase [Rickettsia endosymbiont of Degeeriella rufa]
MSAKASNSSNLPNGHDKTMKEKHNTQPVINGAIKHNTYDEVPYESYPYSFINTFHLSSLATLFGVDAPNVETVKILELGCAAGGNLIPHAVLYPKAHFVGIDLSKVQIDEANKTVKELGLKNIEFHHCSIFDIDDSLNKVDYIICHGVMSWVSKNVRDKIFDVCNKNLSKNGIAYISYNTLPGWNMVRTVRDMMLYHSNSFANVRDKIAQSRLLLDFVKDSLENSKTPYAEVLKTVAGLLSKQTDHYLRHDHLEEENTQFYFHEFMDEARNHNLQYLADCNHSTMYLGNMPQKVVEQLKVVNDIVRTEQYMDFITNRRYMWVTNLKHEPVGVNFFEKLAIRYMDGKHDKKAIIDAVMGNVVKGEINLSKDGEKIEDQEVIRKQLEVLFMSMIDKCAANALLV